MLRFLARESRFRRRCLAEALCELIKLAPRDGRATRYFRFDSSSPQEVYYVFLTLSIPPFDWITYEQYREGRRNLLETCCSTVKLKFTDAQHIIGIATEPGLSNGSYDAIYFDGTEWTEEDATKVREYSEKLDILKNPKMFTVEAQEYPL